MVHFLWCKNDVIVIKVMWPTLPLEHFGTALHTMSCMCLCKQFTINFVPWQDLFCSTCCEPQENHSLAWHERFHGQNEIDITFSLRHYCTKTVTHTQCLQLFWELKCCVLWDNGHETCMKLYNNTFFNSTTLCVKQITSTHYDDLVRWWTGY